MRLGTLDELFRGAVSKRLTPHEVDSKVSNGHEFQGVLSLRKLLGDVKREYPATYILLGDEEGQTVIRSFAVWYDSREKDPKRAAEWRLYYPTEAGHVQVMMRAGDLMVIARTRSDELLIVLARAGSTSEAELKSLFRIAETGDQMQLLEYGQNVEVSVLAARILEQLGITPPPPDPVGDGPLVIELAGDLIQRYPDALPSGKEVSQMIRQRIADVDPVADPDGALVRWIEAEDTVFRLWEDGLIERRLERGFELPDGRKDVQGFREFSMKIRQSRVSRAGGALQLHTAAILKANKLRFEAQAVTENGEKPDFLFPGRTEYQDQSFPAAKLRMLGVKFTAKDRWRQVLNEAERISPKHLLTLEAPISHSQLSAMNSAKLMPVLPRPYIAQFEPASRNLILAIGEFVSSTKTLLG